MRPRCRRLFRMWVIESGPPLFWKVADPGGWKMQLNHYSLNEFGEGHSRDRQINHVHISSPSPRSGQHLPDRWNENVIEPWQVLGSSSAAAVDLGRSRLGENTRANLDRRSCSRFTKCVRDFKSDAAAKVSHPSREMGSTVMRLVRGQCCQKYLFILGFVQINISNIK